MNDRDQGPGEFFQGCPLMALILGDDGRILHANAAFCAELGYGADELRAMRLADLVEPTHREPAAEALAAVAATGARGSFSCSARSKSGAATGLRIDCSRAPGGALIFAVAQRAAPPRGAIEDAAPPAAADGQLFARTRKILQTAIENIPFVLWAVDRDGIFLQSEGLGLEGLGLKPGEAVGKNAFEMYRDAPDVELAIREAFETGSSKSRIVEVGPTVWHTHYIGVRDASGDVNEVVGISLDMTQSARAERELRRRLEIIEAQASAIRELSMPIIQVWDGVLVVPLVGMLDAERAALLMEALLSAVVEASARHVILDLTGVAAVDTATADHLIKLIKALSLVGARATISGIQPGVAGTVVSLDLELSSLTTARNLREALRASMRASG